MRPASRHHRLHTAPSRTRSMIVAIVDYGAGNLRSAAKALAEPPPRRHRRARSSSPPIPRRCAGADRIVLPGVGAFADCMRGLDALPGMVEALDEAVLRARQAVPRHLRRHAADGERRASSSATIKGLGWIKGEVVRARSRRPGAEDPADGLERAATSSAPIRCWPALATGDHAYFVHSYHFVAERPDGRARRRSITAGRLPPCSGATTCSARSSIPRRASMSGLRCSRTSCSGGRDMSDMPKPRSPRSSVVTEPAARRPRRSVRGDRRRDHRRAAASAGSSRRARDVMETYWRGVLLVPERTLFVGRLDGVIAGSAQLVRPPRNNEAQAHSRHADHQLRRALGARPRPRPRMIARSGRGPRARARASAC